MEVPVAFARRATEATDSRASPPVCARSAWTVSLAVSSSSGSQTLRPRLMRASASWVRCSSVMGSCGVLIAASRRMESQGRFLRAVSAASAALAKLVDASMESRSAASSATCAAAGASVGATKMPTSCRPLMARSPSVRGRSALMALISSSVSTPVALRMRRMSGTPCSAL